MSRLIFTAAAIAALASGTTLFGTTAAKAADPVCLEQSDGGTHCDFDTLAQCQASLSGMAGTCEANGSAALMKTKAGMKAITFKHTVKAKK